jgi:hypothetical protein
MAKISVVIGLALRNDFVIYFWWASCGLEPAGGMTVDELLNEIKTKNHNLFNIKGDTIYVPPISANESELIVYN